MANKLSRSDFDLSQYKDVRSANALATAALATATLTAPGAGRRQRLVTVDASYEVSTQSGLLTVKSGVTTIAQKYIHGAGAIDFHEKGRPADAINEAMSAELAAGAAGIDGTVTICGFDVSEDV